MQGDQAAVKAPVSVLVPTMDEELNLPECLDSIAWADEVFVVDSFSQDRTVEIARARGAHAVQHPFETYARQKNWALDTVPLRHEWVLILDADERVTPELRAEIESLLAGGPACAGFYVNRRLIFLGRWIRHAGWYPSWNLRLFQHRLGRYEDRPVHEHVVLEGRVGYLRHDLLHLDRRPLEAFIARHNRYSTLEAEARFATEWARHPPPPPQHREATVTRASHAASHGRHTVGFSSQTASHGSTSVTRASHGPAESVTRAADRQAESITRTAGGQAESLIGAARGEAESVERAAYGHARSAARASLGEAQTVARSLASALFGAPVERKRFVRERIWPRVPAKPLALFLYMYLLRRGFLDGRAGLVFCVFHAFQEFMVGLKLEELRRGAR